MGLPIIMDRIFRSRRMGVAKTRPGLFCHIEQALGKQGAEVLLIDDLSET